MAFYGLRSPPGWPADDGRRGRDGWVAPPRALARVLEPSPADDLDVLEAIDRAVARRSPRRRAVDSGFAGPEIG